jgi:hypothetical protein
MSYN